MQPPAQGPPLAAEAALRQSEARFRFLADLAAAVQPLTDPDEVMAITARLLGGHLGADRCAYAEVEGGSVFRITGDATWGVPSIVGRWPVAAFGPEVVRCMAANEAYIVHDIEADARAGPGLEAYRRAAVRAMICVPLHKGGTFAAAMAVHQKVPRRWTDAEVALVRVVADRCWESIERARVERNLRQSEARFRAIVEATSQSVWSFDPAGGEGAFSASRGWWEALTGQTAQQQLADPRVWLDAVHPDDRPAAEAAWAAAVAAGKPYDAEYRVRSRTGTYRHVHARGVPILGPGGEVREWVGTLDDITEQREAQRAIRDSEERLRLALEAARLGDWRWDAASDIITLSPRTAAIYGVPVAPPLTRARTRAMVHEEDRERMAREVDFSISSGRPYDVEYRVRRPDGAVVWVSARGRAWYDADGRARGTFGVVQDVTARKRAEQTARFLADTATALAEVTDYEGTLRRIAALAVPRFADWCAVDMVQPDGPPRRLAVMHVDPGKVELAREIYHRYPPRPDDPRSVPLVLRTGEPDWAAEVPDEVLVAAAQDEEHLRFLRQLGMRSYVCVPLRSRAGLLGAVTFVTAESGRTYDLDDVLAAQDLASRFVVAIENATLLAALAEADRRKDRFLATLAHELRNPLAPIRNSLHFLELRGGDWAAVAQARAMMERQVHHLGRLVDDLLDISRITLGKVQLRKERLEMGRLLRQCAEAHRAAFAARKVALTLTAPDQLVMVSADPTRLSQVVDNLLANALKFTGEGGVVEASLAEEGERVTLRVRDSGVGIDADMLPKLFDAFAQADRTLDRSQGGLGLGLAVVKGLVELHGGGVRAQSDGLGRGATFTVSLPRADAAALVPEAEAPRESAPALRVLVVEDNRDSADSLCLVLRAYGYAVTVAYDGPNGVRAAEQHRPQVVICDIGLPGLDGYGVAAALRQNPETADARLIALTGYGQEEDRRRAREAGFDEHLTKPADLSVLRGLLAGAG